MIFKGAFLSVMMVASSAAYAGPTCTDAYVADCGAYKVIESKCTDISNPAYPASFRKYSAESKIADSPKIPLKFNFQTINRLELYAIISPYSSIHFAYRGNGLWETYTITRGMSPGAVSCKVP